MGTFRVRFTVRHPAHPHQQCDLEGLVDTGALFTQIPADALAGIGIEPSGTRVVHYADGTRDVVPVAKADIAIDGVETATVILCGRAGSLVLVGATTLETLGLGVDPVHKKLVPIDAPMARLVCTPIDAGVSRASAREHPSDSQAPDFASQALWQRSCLPKHGLQDSVLGGA